MRRSIFWGEMAPCDHLVQLYRNDAEFTEVLEEFVVGGLRAQEAVIVIATPEHRVALEKRLAGAGFDLEDLRADGRYIALDAHDTLERFMVDGIPDEVRFGETVASIVARARRGDRAVRAFGEMVAILWSRGHYAATVRLEHLWNRFQEREHFPLLCAYPRSGFTMSTTASLREIRDAHTRAIA